MTVVPIYATTVTASPYPTPTTNEFLYLNYNENSNEDKTDRFIVHSAFLPFSTILQAAISALANKKNDIYDRWFPATVKQGGGKPDVDGRGSVSSVYSRLIISGSNPTP